MRDFEIVVATDAQRGIGRNGKLPWHLPGDMKFFRDLTTETSAAGKENAVIMGRKTWESIPSRFRPLPGRVNIVLSRGARELPAGVHLAASFDEAVGLLDTAPLNTLVERVFVIGGAQIYEEALKRPECRVLHVTQLLETFECDAFFPPYHVDFERSRVSKPFREGAITYFFSEYHRIA